MGGTCLRVGLAATLLASLLFAFALAGGTAERAAADGCRFAQAAVKNLTQTQFRKGFHCLVNRKRSARNLRGNPDLNRAALSHSRYMRNHNCFSHYCPGELAPFNRVKRTGYFDGARGFDFGEVIALARPGVTPRRVLRKYLRSPEHKQLLMSSRFRHIGSGFAIGNRRAYFTSVLGDRSY